MDYPHRHRLNAYHDAELGDAEARELERHLETCPSCAAELDEILKVSEAFAGLVPSGISRAAMARAHAAADDACERVESAARGRRLLVRVASVLTAVAASVLVVASAWLLEPPAAPTGNVNLAVAPGSTVGPAAEWERIAMTLDAGPLRSDSPDAPGRLALAAAASDGDEVRVADWMVRSLNR
jgi:anti-sigma factor RsiW